MTRRSLEVQASVKRWKRERWIRAGGWAVLAPLVLGWAFVVFRLLWWAR